MLKGKGRGWGGGNKQEAKVGQEIVAVGGEEKGRGGTKRGKMIRAKK